MTRQLIHHNANVGGTFATSTGVLDTFASIREDAAIFVNARDSREMVFGNNMTTLSQHLSRALANRIEPGMQIIVSEMCHDANVSPWLAIAQERGCDVRWIRADPESYSLDMASLEEALSSDKKTFMVALGYASNLIGTVNDVQRACTLAREAGALSFVDAVHYAPHGIIDVQAVGCDFLACSPYKFFGPHCGMLYGREELLAELPSYKVRPCADELPTMDNYHVSKWETGTQNYEALAGAAAAMRYIGRLAGEAGYSRAGLEASWGLIAEHERSLSTRFLAGLASMGGIQVYGITDTEVPEGTLARRTPTFSIRKGDLDPAAATAALVEQGLWCSYGNFYAQQLSEKLGIEETGFVTRMGFLHYNTLGEVDRALEAIERL